MSKDPIGDDARRSARERRLGPDAACVICGEPSLECLTQVAERLIENHHVVGRNHNPDLTVPVCQNCHLKLHEKMLQEGVDPTSQSSSVETRLQVVRCLAAFFPLLGDGLSKLAEEEEQLITKLDKEMPTWRDMAE